MTLSDYLQSFYSEGTADASTYTSNPPSSLAATNPYGYGSGLHGNRQRDIGKFVTNIAGKVDEDTVVSIN